MKLHKALKKLHRRNVLGVSGTDWSWFYQLGSAADGICIVDEDGNERKFGYIDFIYEDWVLISKKELKKRRKDRR